MRKTKQEQLADFARVVLEVMENEPEWGADMNDRIAGEAIERGLAELDDDGMFKAK